MSWFERWDGNWSGDWFGDDTSTLGPESYLRRKQTSLLAQAVSTWKTFLKPNWSAAVVVPITRTNLLIVPWDEKAELRTRRHEQYVAEVLNSLFWRDQLEEGSPGVYNLTYSAAVPAHWNGSPPETIWEALDRIAILLTAQHHGA